MMLRGSHEETAPVEFSLQSAIRIQSIFGLESSQIQFAQFRRLRRDGRRRAM